jgi:hypothetical protein
MSWSWTDKWPASVGVYWFYGWLLGDTSVSPELRLVRVRQTVNGPLVYVSDIGIFAYKNEAAGIWIRATLPNYNQKIAQLYLQDVKEAHDSKTVSD